MTGQQAGPVWPSACPPAGRPLLLRGLSDVAQLPEVRAALRSPGTTGRPDSPADVELREQMILALDEMASNALRHGGGHVRATVQVTEDSYLIEVTDQATSTPPRPAVDRDPSEGGLGLYLIAELATEYGWYVKGGTKYVWALLPSV